MSDNPHTAELERQGAEIETYILLLREHNTLVRDALENGDCDGAKIAKAKALFTELSELMQAKSQTTEAQGEL